MSVLRSRSFIVSSLLMLVDVRKCQLLVFTKSYNQHKIWSNIQVRNDTYPLFGDFHIKNWTIIGTIMPTKAQKAVTIPTVAARFILLWPEVLLSHDFSPVERNENKVRKATIERFLYRSLFIYLLLLWVVYNCNCGQQNVEYFALLWSLCHSSKVGGEKLCAEIYEIVVPENAFSCSDSKHLFRILSVLLSSFFKKNARLTVWLFSIDH